MKTKLALSLLSREIPVVGDASRAVDIEEVDKAPLDGRRRGGLGSSCLGRRNQL
jgi:hypothetical protein